MTIRTLLTKYKQLFRYLFWGVATTGVNYCIYFLATRLGQLHYIAANILSWLGAVLFAFWGNKCFVFSSKSWKCAILIPEFCKFTGARIFSGFLETMILWLCVDLWHMHDGIVKLLAGFIVIMMNYIFSKIFIFRRRSSDG